MLEYRSLSAGPVPACPSRWSPQRQMQSHDYQEIHDSCTSAPGRGRRLRRLFGSQRPPGSVARILTEESNRSTGSCARTDLATTSHTADHAARRRLRKSGTTEARTGTSQPECPLRSSPRHDTEPASHRRRRHRLLATPRNRCNRHPSACMIAAILGTSGLCRCGSTACPRRQRLRLSLGEGACSLVWWHKKTMVKR